MGSALATSACLLLLLVSGSLKSAFCAVLRESRSMDKTFAQRMQSKLSAPVSSAFGMPSITIVHKRAH